MKEKTTKVGDREYHDYELDSKVRTLQEAEEIQSDSALMAALEPRLTKMIGSITSLKQLRARAAKLAKAGR